MSQSGTDVLTQVNLISKNSVSDEERRELLERYNADTLQEVADMLRGNAEVALRQTFRDADEFLQFEVNVEVDE